MPDGKAGTLPWFYSTKVKCAVSLTRVAERLWYGRSVPDLGKVPEPYRRDVGYLVDRLARFNVVNAGRKQKVLAALTPYKPLSTAEWQNYRDALASAWGASAELTPRLAELLPYQTREYAEERKVKVKRYRQASCFGVFRGMLFVINSCFQTTACRHFAKSTLNIPTKSLR